VTQRLVDGAPKSAAYEESRVWVATDGVWRN
jgi:hypothetical protein